MLKRIDSNWDRLRICKLDDGTITEYHFCSEDKDCYSKENFIYLGEGTIKSIDGVEQHIERKYHFWTKKWN